MGLHQVVPLMASAAVLFSGLLVFAALPRNKERSRARTENLREFLGWSPDGVDQTVAESQVSEPAPVWGNLDLTIFGSGGNAPAVRSESGPAAVER